MVVTEKDIVVIKKSNEMDTTAEYIAKKRLLFEYPREGYGKYDSSHLSNIKVGILGELAFLEYFTYYLNKKYGSIEPIKRWSIIHKQIGFSYLIVIGKFDGGHEFKIGKSKEILVDVKTYEKNQVTMSQIFNGLKDDPEKKQPLNLFIDKNQNTKADIYIQSFILKNGDIALVGFNEGLPPLADWMPNPAYTKPVPELEPMQSLISRVNEICKLS